MSRNRAKAIKNDTVVTHRPALTPEAKENQMISLAVDLAERQLREGTASSQVITHFLKMGSSKERLEQEIMEVQKKLIVAKADSITSAKRIEGLYTKALGAMKLYSGGGKAEEDEERESEYS